MEELVLDSETLNDLTNERKVKSAVVSCVYFIFAKMYYYSCYPLTPHEIKLVPLRIC